MTDETDDESFLVYSYEDISDIVLIMFGLLLMTYANLVIFNTGSFVVFVEKTTTFSYTPPWYSIVAGMGMYVLSFLILLSVGTGYSRRVSGFSGLAPAIYGVVGLLFLRYLFSESQRRTRVIGGKTDGYVLQVEGAKRLLNGNNPYLYDYGTEILNQVPGYFRTPKTPFASNVDVSQTSNIVTHLDYPPASVLWYLPSQALGIDGAAQDIVAMMLLIGVIFYLTPHKYRPFVGVFVLVDWNFILFPSAYIPDSGWVVPTVLALILFHYPRANALLLAFAASYRPQPIIIATFMGVMAYHEYGLPYLKRWVLTGLAATAAINIPFALWTGVGRYWEYITIPISISIPPGGVGPAILVKYGIVSVNPLTIKPFFTVAVFFAWFTSLLVVYLFYEDLGAGMYALPGIVLWFHWRSLQNYMLWIPLLVFTVYLLGIPERDPVMKVRNAWADWRSEDHEPIVEQYAD